MWTTQIIHNIIYNNRYIYPPFYIIFCSIDKLFFTLFIYESLSLKVIIIPSIIILLNIFIIYLQTFLWPRFMLCGKCQDPTFIFYKTKFELLNLYPNSKNEKCSICLSSLLNEENEDKKVNTNNDIKNEDNKINNNGSKNNIGRLQIKAGIIGSKEYINNQENTNENDVYRYRRCVKDSEHNLKNHNKKNNSIDMEFTIIETNDLKKKNDKHNCIFLNIIKIVFLDFYIYNSKSKPKYLILS